MATVFPCLGLLALCSLAAPATTLAQDASIGFGQQSSSTQSSSTSQTTETTRSTSGSSNDDSAGKNMGDSAFGNLGSMTTRSSSTGSSHSESRSERKGAEIDIGFHEDRSDDWSHDRHRGDPVNESDLFGNWTLGQENGNSCTIELKNSPWFGGYGAWVPAGCPDEFFAANRWLLSGNQLLITDTDNKVIGRFRQSGGGRWSGQRESDGARLYLNQVGR